MPARTAPRSMDDRIRHPECNADVHDGRRPCVCPTRRQKEYDGAGGRAIPKVDPKHEARFHVMPDATSPLHVPSEDDTRAACAGMDVNLFYPIGSGSDARTQERHAKAVCQRCPIQKRCGEDAIERGEQGIWGGLSEDDRREVRRRRSMDAVAA